MNVALFVPLGIAVLLLPRLWQVLAATVAAVALSPAVETAQAMLPRLHRVCSGADIAANLTGLAIGLAAGLLLRLFLTLLALRPHPVPPRHDPVSARPGPVPVRPDWLPGRPVTVTGQHLRSTAGNVAPVRTSHADDGEHRDVASGVGGAIR
jgi:hypothetical protein